MTSVATRFNTMSQYAESFPRSIGGPPQASQWEAIFGPMADKPAPSPYSQYPVEHFQLPKAYEGQNVFLAEKISGLVNTTGDFWTNKLLPWYQTDHIGPFTWSEWIFNQTLASRLPHEGVPRLISTSEKSFQATPVRRGLAAEFEADFANHPRGQIMMARKIQGMIVSIQTTVNVDVQSAILMSQDEKKTRNLKHKLTRVPISDQVNTEVVSWNAVSKNPRAFMKLAMRTKRLLINQGAQPPFTLLVTPETTVHMREENMPARPNEVTSISSSEQKLSENLLANSQEFSRLRDGTEVIEIKDINVTDNSVPDQLFTTQSIIGEFFTIDWSPYANANLDNGCGYGSSHYCSDLRTILIHDMELDVLAKITLKECIENGGQTGFPDLKLLKQVYDSHGAGWGSQGGQNAFYPEKNSYSKNSNDRHAPRRSAHMMFFKEDDDTRLVRHVGNFDENVVSERVKKQMGQTLVKAANLTEEDINAANNFVYFMNVLENADGESDTKRGKFLTDFLDLNPLDDLPSSLKIPDYIPDLPSIPPGLASWKGIQALSQLSESNYGGLAGQAKSIVKLVKKLYNAWTRILTLDLAKGFDKGYDLDDIEAFFSNIIYMYRPYVE